MHLSQNLTHSQAVKLKLKQNLREHKLREMHTTVDSIAKK